MSVAQGEKQATKRELNPREEMFAQVFARTGCQSTAYKESHAARKSTKPESIWQAASRVARNVKVKSRIQELRAEIAKSATEETKITVEFLTNGYLEAVQMAKMLKKPIALTGAYTALGKLHGLIVDKNESKQVNVDLAELLRERRAANMLRAGPARNVTQRILPKTFD